MKISSHTWQPPSNQIYFRIFHTFSFSPTVSLTRNFIFDIMKSEKVLLRCETCEHFISHFPWEWKIFLWEKWFWIFGFFLLWAKNKYFLESGNRKRRISCHKKKSVTSGIFFSERRQRCRCAIGWMGSDEREEKSKTYSKSWSVSGLLEIRDFRRLLVKFCIKIPVALNINLWKCEFIHKQRKSIFSFHINFFEQSFSIFCV